MSLRQVIDAFCDFRQEVVVRRTRFLLNKARDRAHILAGLLIALTSIDEVIELIRSAKTGEEARVKLMDRDWPAAEVAGIIKLIDDPGHEVIDDSYRLSETQARAILELRLQRLTGMEREKLADETEQLAKDITYYLEILSSQDKLVCVILEELQDAYDRLAEPRRTEISDALADQDDEDLIQQEDMVVTVSHRGYIKRVALADYRAQRRGGKGRTGMKTREEDYVTRLFVANTHTPILFFTSKGMVYQLKCYKLPVASHQSIGKAMVNLLPIDQDETIQTVMPMPSDVASWGNLNILFATAKGTIRRNLLSDFTNIMRNGKIAMKLGDDDRLISVLPCQETDQVLIASRFGKAIRFNVEEVRLFRGRNSVGVRGMRLKDGDEAVSICVIRDPQREYVLSVTENGFGKRTAVSEDRKNVRFRLPVNHKHMGIHINAKRWGFEAEL